MISYLEPYGSIDDVTGMFIGKKKLERGRWLPGLPEVLCFLERWRLQVGKAAGLGNCALLSPCARGNLIPRPSRVQ